MKRLKTELANELGYPVFASMAGSEQWLQSKSLVLKGMQRVRDENSLKLRSPH